MGEIDVQTLTAPFWGGFFFANNFKIIFEQNFIEMLDNSCENCYNNYATLYNFFDL